MCVLVTYITHKSAQYVIPATGGEMSTSSRRVGAGVLCAGLAMAGYSAVRAADHDDSPSVGADQAADIADVYAFRSADNPSNVVLAMTLSDVLPPGQIELGRSIFDPRVLYQFKLDNNGDGVEDRVIQAYVVGTPAHQILHVRGPIAPAITGATSRMVPSAVTISTRVSTGTTPIVTERNGMRLFAGVRDDPFFFDLGRFSAILAGQATSFANPGTDAFAGLNTYAIVIELPATMIGNLATTAIWATTSR
jgi:hypothetical protein